MGIALIYKNRVNFVTGCRPSWATEALLLSKAGLVDIFVEVNTRLYIRFVPILFGLKFMRIKTSHFLTILCFFNFLFLELFFEVHAGNIISIQMVSIQHFDDIIWWWHFRPQCFSSSVVLFKKDDIGVSALPFLVLPLDLFTKSFKSVNKRHPFRSSFYMHLADVSQKTPQWNSHFHEEDIDMASFWMTVENILFF